MLRQWREGVDLEASNAQAVRGRVLEARELPDLRIESVRQFYEVEL